MKIETKHLDQKQIDMAIIYELSIKNIDASPTEGDLQDVVKIIHWMYIGKETVNGEDLYGDA